MALPGDVVEMRGEVLYVNQVAAEYSDPTVVDEPLDDDHSLPAQRATEQWADSRRSVQFLPDVMARRDFGPLTVPADHFFMLGDNRDNSEDSRYIGAVPRHLLIGRAHRVLVSADITGAWWPRFERTVSAIR